MQFCLALKQISTSLSKVRPTPPLKRNQDRIAILIHLLPVDLSRLTYHPIALGSHSEICG
jgi:hypothetical protein